MSTAFAALERCRAAVGELITAAAREVEHERQQDQARAAEAMEHLAGSGATAAAYQQGRHDERQRVLALLSAQQEALCRSGVNSLSLATLKRTIKGEE